MNSIGGNTMEEYISRLNEIKKEELDERVFYEEVLSVIKDMENVSLTPESFEQIKKTLQDIGCVSYEEWKVEKEREGEKKFGAKIGKGIEKANIETAVSFVSQLLYDYNNAAPAFL